MQGTQLSVHQVLLFVGMDPLTKDTVRDNETVMFVVRDRTQCYMYITLVGCTIYLCLWSYPSG